MGEFWGGWGQVVVGVMCFEDSGKAEGEKNFVWWRKHQQHHVSNFISKSALSFVSGRHHR
jgi:hypothetical protein